LGREARQIPSIGMTLRLTVESDAWNHHVSQTVNSLGDVLPVVKGNGYGFGRAVLMQHASRLSSDVAVGTVHELGEVPAAMRPFVLTPLGVGVVAPPRTDAVLAIGAEHDLHVLQQLGATNPVVIKVASSMQRYGIGADQVTELRKRAESFGHRVVAWSLHLPLIGSDEDHINEAVAVAQQLPADVPLHVSHIGPAVERLRERLQHRIVARTGTQLWLGDKSMLSLQADVIAVRHVASATAGYRATPVPVGSRIAMVGCGSSHGVAALDDGQSPFHFARQRLAMLEAPHMHTTMLCIELEPAPREGNWVDVQQPLTRVYPDVIEWR